MPQGCRLLRLSFQRDQLLAHPAKLDLHLAEEHRIEATGVPPQMEVVEQVCPKFEASQVFFIARRKLPDADMVYFSVKTMNGIVMLAEVGFRPGTGTASISIKAQQGQYVGLLSESIQKLLRA